jgi:hypothetical protein
MPEVTVNYLVVLVSAIVSMIIGSIWYSPAVFGKQWMRLVGKTQEDIQKMNKGPVYGGMFLLALVLAYVMSHIIDFAQATTISRGLKTGFWTWLGFVATTKGAEYLFLGKPRTLYMIDVGYHLVEFLVIGALIAVWQ